MSVVASFHLMSKEKLDEYCRIARLLPKGTVKRKGYTRMVTRKTQNLSDFQNQKQDDHAQFEYLQKNSTRPCEYDWSGSILYDLMCCLKEMKNIDLMENTLDDGYGREEYVFDSAVKNKCLGQLDPSNFTEKELKYWNTHIQRERSDEMARQAGSKLGTERLERMLDFYKYCDFPEAGEAMMNGIVVIHNCLKLVDDKNVILMEIG